MQAVCITPPSDIRILPLFRMTLVTTVFRRTACRPVLLLFNLFGLLWNYLTVALQRCFYYTACFLDGYVILWLIIVWFPPVCIVIINCDLSVTTIVLSIQYLFILWSVVILNCFRNDLALRLNKFHISSLFPKSFAIAVNFHNQIRNNIQV